MHIHDIPMRIHDIAMRIHDSPMQLWGVVIRLCKLIYPSGEVLNGAVQDFPRRGLKKEYLTNNLKKKNGNY